MEKKQTSTAECQAFKTNEMSQQLPILRERYPSVGDFCLFVLKERDGCILQLCDVNAICPHPAPAQSLETPHAFN